LNQPEELNLELNSRFRSSNGQTRANILFATFERLREMPYGPSIKVAEQAGEAEGSVGLDRLVSDGPRFVNPIMEELPTNRPMTSQKPV